MILRALGLLFFVLLGSGAAHAQCSTAYPKAALDTQVTADFPDNTSGLITPLTMRTFLPNLIQSFQQFPGVNAQLGTTYVIQLSDYGQLVTFLNNTLPIAVTLPAANTTGFCPFAFFSSNLGVGVATFTPASGTVGGASSYQLTTNSGAYFVSDGTNWQVIGFKVGSITINGATQNSIGYYAATGTTISGFPPADNAVVVTDGSGNPSESTTLPSGLTVPSPTVTGTLTAPDAGTWASGGLTASAIDSVGTLTFGVLSPTSLGASPTTVTGLTTNNSPSTSNDYVPYYNAASGTIEKATVGSIAAAATAGVSSLNGLTGGLSVANFGGVNVSPSGTTLQLSIPIMQPAGRLTLQTGVPVMNTTQAAKSTLYYDCFHGGRTVPYFNGTVDAQDTIVACEVSTAMASTGAGVLNNAGVFDVWWEGNTFHNICIATNGSGGGWASDSGGSNTARGTGYTQLDFTTRPYITNKNSIANCYNGTTNLGTVVANRLTYIGTIFTTAAGQTTWQYGLSGTAAVLGVWNAYNRVAVGSGDAWPSTSSWTYSTASFRQADASATAQVSYVAGLNEDTVFATTASEVQATSAGVCENGIGIDSTSVNTGTIGISMANAASSNVVAFYNGYPGVGLHVIAGLEKNNAGGGTLCTWFGGGGSINMRLGM